MGAVIGAVASLVQLGIGLKQENDAKRAGEKALLMARNQPKQENVFSSQQIPVEAYQAQEQANARAQANMIQAVSEQGAVASIGGLPALQQQAENANAELSAQKAKDIASIKQQELATQQQIDADYLAYQRQLDQMEILGAGQAVAQGGAMTMAGLGGIS